jgi:hypothetical protein
MGERPEEEYRGKDRDNVTGCNPLDLSDLRAEGLHNRRQGDRDDLDVQHAHEDTGKDNREDDMAVAVPR